jgi:hypothetical protein
MELPYQDNFRLHVKPLANANSATPTPATTKEADKTVKHSGYGSNNIHH